MAKNEIPSNNLSWIILIIILASDAYVHLNAQDFPLDQYLGCFHDNKIRGSFDENLTVETCIRYCKLNETQSFAKLQNGTHCECVNEYGSQVKDSVCSITCKGNPSENCGGSNSLFSAYVLYAVCPIGTYGPQCKKSCHCKRQMPCDRQSGNCSNGCHGNYTGPSCNELKLYPAQYIGCYRDGSNVRAMEPRMPDDDSANSLQRCADVCSSENHSYSGTQFGRQCFCGESYSKYGTRNETYCNKKCPGNQNETCGGHLALSVYHSCPTGFYGRYCGKVCNCETSRCVFRNGSCQNNTCKPGWSGDACNLRDCSDDNGDCNSDEVCVSVEPIANKSISVCRPCPNEPCGRSDLSIAMRFECFIKLMMPHLKYVAPSLVMFAILVPIAIFCCRRSRNKKGDFQTKRAKIAAFLSAEIIKVRRKPPAMPDIEACEKRTPASINNSIEDLTKAANPDSAKCKENLYQVAFNKGADIGGEIKPKKRPKIPSPDDSDAKDRVTLSKQEKTKRTTAKPIIPDPEQCVKFQPEHGKGADEKTKRKPKKSINPDPKVSEEKDQNEFGKSADEKAERKTKKRALPVPKDPEEKEHPELGKSADEKTKKTKKFAAPESEKTEEKEQRSTKPNRKSNLYVFAERRTTNKPALPMARETKMLSKQSKPTSDCGVKTTPEKSAYDDYEGEVYTGLENTANNDEGEGEVYTALEAGNTATCSNASKLSHKRPNRK